MAAEQGGGGLGSAFACSAAGTDAATGVGVGLLGLLGVAVARGWARRRAAR